MKKLEDLTKYVQMPNVNPVGGFIYNGDDWDLCDDTDSDYETIENDKGEKIEIEISKVHVKQIIKDGKLITDLETKYQMRNGKWVNEISHLEVELAEGVMLVYKKGEGFIIPQFKLATVEEAVKMYDILN